MRSSAHLTLAIAIATLAACTGDGPAAPGAPASIAFSEPSLSVTLRGTAHLAPIVRDEDGRTIVNATGVTWESSDTDIASVDEAGTIHGHALGGPVTIRMNAGSAEGTVQVTVVPASAGISPSISALAIGSSVQLTLAATDALGGAIPNGNVSWSSTNTAVASVDPQTGQLNAVSVGNATINAQADGFTAGAGIYVGVPASFDGQFVSTDTPQLNVSLTIYLGRITHFNADYRPADICSFEFGGTPNIEVPGFTQGFQFRLANWATQVVVNVISDTVIVGGIGTVPAAALSPGCLQHYGLSNVQNLSSRNVVGPGFTIRRP
jgi:hypothetical protein